MSDERALGYGAAVAVALARRTACAIGSDSITSATAQVYKHPPTLVRISKLVCRNLPECKTAGVDPQLILAVMPSASRTGSQPPLSRVASISRRASGQR
jgi:hypothetical protein